MPKLSNNQSDLQFGFTRGLSPIMAALIVSEVILQAKLQKSNLYLVTLDSQKAFDVVHHMLLLRSIPVQL
jgi:type IV secretory pathway component VirB8